MLKETFIKGYTVERTNGAEIRPEEQSEKAESCRENLWNEIQLKGPQDRNRPKKRLKRSGQTRLVYVKDICQPCLPTPFNSALVSISVLWPFQLYFVL